MFGLIPGHAEHTRPGSGFSDWARSLKPYREEVFVKSECESSCALLPDLPDTKSKRPLAIELYAGRMGWGKGLSQAGWRVIGFDIEHLPHHGTPPEYCSLVLQDVLTLQGRQLKDARLIVASSPCQKYSWLAMPWSRSGSGSCRACRFSEFDRPFCKKCGGSWVVENSQQAKELRRKWESDGPDNSLFSAARRLQLEAISERKRILGCCSGSNACHCSRCYIPLVQENVRGAQEWVGLSGPCIDIPRAERMRLGRSKAKYGSFHLWGDVGMVGTRIVANRRQLRTYGRSDSPKLGNGLSWSDYGKPGYKAFGFNVENEKRLNGIKVPGEVRDEKYRFTTPRVKDGTKNSGGSWFSIANNTTSGKNNNPVSRNDPRDDGTKIGGDWFRDPACHSTHGSKSSKRKIASALIAEIPIELSRFIGEAFYPREDA